MKVKERADAIGTFRYTSVFIMETLAGWVPTTPEMEVKVLFGRHLWTFAQRADVLGKRARELRAPLQYSREPRQEYLEGLRAVAALQATGDRLEGCYDIVLPSLAACYSRYLARTDRLIDEPSVVLCEGALLDIEKLRAEKAQLLAEIAGLRSDPRPALRGLRTLFVPELELIEPSDEDQTTAGTANASTTV